MVTEAHQIQQAAAREILRRRHALDDLTDFREYMVETQSADFEHPPAKHHKLIMSHLEKLERGEIQRLLILAPPGSAKSTYCSIQYPLWRLARRPNRNILCASNTQDLAEHFNRRRRNLALTPEWMRLSQTKLAADLQGAGHFGTDREGGIRAAGVGSSITGFRSHLNILDDPIRGVEEAFSATALDKQWDWYHSDFRSRLVPGSPELIVSTRWARKDIAGRFLDLMKEGKERWTVLRLPMLADSDEDPLGRPLNESLWPAWFDPTFIAEKQQNVLMWSTQYQQIPLDESGSWVGNEHIKYAEHPPLGEPHRIIAIDLALSVGKGDWTVFVVGQLDANRRLHIIHVERARIGPDEAVDTLFELCWIYQPREVLADDDNATKVFKAAVHERLRQPKQGQHPFALHLLPMRGKDKETRAAAIRAMFLRGDVKLLKASWTATLVRELTEFPSGDHDDQVDALGLIGRRFPMLSAPEKPRNADDFREKMLFVPGNDGQYVMQGGLDEMFEARERKRRRMGNRV